MFSRISYLSELVEYVLDSKLWYYVQVIKDVFISVISLFREKFLLLFSIFTFVFLSILLIRTIFNFLLYLASKRYKNRGNVDDYNNFPSKYSFVSKGRKFIYYKHKLIFEEDELEREIVGIVEPIGYWTSLIIGERLSNLVQMAYFMNKHNKRGFWVSMVIAQKKSTSRQKSRAR